MQRLLKGSELQYLQHAHTVGAPNTFLNPEFRVQVYGVRRDQLVTETMKSCTCSQVKELKAWKAAVQVD